jgi:VanZ family protein
MTPGRSEYYILLLFEMLFLFLAVQAVSIGDTTRFYGVLASMGIALLPLLAEWGLSVRFPPGVKVVIALALFLHVAGGVNRWYWKFAPIYDKLAHVVAALALGMVIFTFFLILDTRRVRIRPSGIIAAMIVIVVILGGLWEIGEYSIDLLVRSSYNNGVMDTILDTIANLIGLLIAVLYAWWIMKKVPAGQTPGYLVIPRQAPPPNT